MFFEHGFRRLLHHHEATRINVNNSSSIHVKKFRNTSKDLYILILSPCTILANADYYDLNNPAIQMKNPTPTAKIAKSSSRIDPN